jgi:uncharacterized protein
MSEGAGLPGKVVQTGPSPPSLPSARERSPLVEFCIDVVIAMAVMLAMSLFAGLLWGLLLVIEMAGKGLDSAAIAARAAQPGLLLQMGTAALSVGTAALVLVLWRRRPTAGERAQSRIAARRGVTWALSIGTGLLTTLLTTGLSSLADAASIDITPTNEAMIRGLTVQSPWLLIPFAAVLAPIYEEVLFRRVFYGRLLAAGRPLLGLALSAGLFALMHEIPGLGGNPWTVTLALWTVYAALGVAFALLYRRCGTLWAPIGAHATHNLLACVLLLNELA